MKSQIRFAFLFALGASLFAAGPIVDRNRDQAARIAQGVRSGALTPRETARLRQEEFQLRQRIHRDRIDGGGLSTRERIAIDRRQDQLSRQIYRQKHDGQHRW